MAARKKKAKRAARPKKAKKAAARKSTKKSKKTAKSKKKVKAAARRAPARKAAKKPSKKTSGKKTIGEGDYAASRAFLKDQSDFVGKNKAKISGLGKEAEKALEGPEGAGLREAEATAAARSRDTF